MQIGTTPSPNVVLPVPRDRRVSRGRQRDASAGQRPQPEARGPVRSHHTILRTPEATPSISLQTHLHLECCTYFAANASVEVSERSMTSHFRSMTFHIDDLQRKEDLSEVSCALLAAKACPHRVCRSPSAEAISTTKIGVAQGNRQQKLLLASRHCNRCLSLACPLVSRLLCKAKERRAIHEGRASSSYCHDEALS